MPFIIKPFVEILDEIDQNLDTLYLFGDNCARKGTGVLSGQAVIRNRRNAIGIRTKIAPNNRPEAFFSDDKYDLYQAMIANDFQKALDYLKQGGTVVCPAEGIGTGRAKLKEKAPRLFSYLQSLIYILSRVDICNIK